MLEHTKKLLEKVARGEKTIAEIQLAKKIHEELHGPDGNTQDNRYYQSLCEALDILQNNIVNVVDSQSYHDERARRLLDW